MSDTTASRRGAVAVAGFVAALALVLLAMGVSLRLLGDFDMPLHIATGRRVWETGHVPRVDDFSYLHGTVRYTELASVSLFWWAYRVGGALGLQLVGGLSAAGIAAALWAQTRRFGPIAFVACALAIAGSTTFLVVRSSALSFPLLALTLLALDVHRRAAGTPRGRKALGAFVGLSFVWANTHGSVPFGLVVGAMYAAYRATCRVARGRLGGLLPAADGSDAPAAALAVTLAVAVASVNTAGPGLLLGPLRFGGQVHTLASFTEWARPTWGFYRDHEPVAALVLVAAVLSMALGRDADTGERTPALYEVGLLAMALACSATAVRLVPFAMILSSPLVARRLSRAVRPRGESAVVPLVCSACALLAPASVLVANVPLGIGFDPTHLPEGAARWAEAYHPTGNLWNSPPFGGYLAFRLYPEVRILMDGRHGTAYPIQDVLEVEASEVDPATFASLEREHDLQWAVTRALEGASDGLPLAASPDWAMVFLDDVASVYVRRDGPNAPMAGDGYRVLRHTSPPGAVLALAEHPGDAAGALAHDGELAAAQAPGSARAAFLAACGAIAARDAAAFADARARLAALAPGNPAITAVDGVWARVHSLP
ncbi:MAG TPA: hypothetical protein VF765_25290 [Polyangiaceae bacterium]